MNVLQSMIKQLIEKWVSVSDSERISTKTLQRIWYLELWTMKLSQVWKEVSIIPRQIRKMKRAARWWNLYDYTVWIDGKAKKKKLF